METKPSHTEQKGENKRQTQCVRNASSGPKVFAVHVVGAYQYNLTKRQLITLAFYCTLTEIVEGPKIVPVTF